MSLRRVNYRWDNMKIDRGLPKYGYRLGHCNDQAKGWPILEKGFDFGVGSILFLFFPSGTHPAPLFDDYLGLLKSTIKIRRALSYSRIRAVMHHRDIVILCGKD
jgi:hypothetical protein